MERDADTETPMLDTNITKITGDKFKQYAAALSVCLGAVCAGTSLSWTSPVFDQLIADKNSTNNSLPLSSQLNNSSKTFTLTDHEAATIGGMLAIGALVSAIPAGFFADRFGRKKVILTISLAFLLNYLLIIFANNATMLIVARFFAGVGTGAICVTAPMYIGEIAETSIRGVLGSFFQLTLCSGVLFTCIIGSFTSWVVLSIVLATIPVAFGLIFLLMPESPVYLVKINQMEAAERVLRSLRGSTYDVNSELKAIQKEIEEANEKTATIKDILLSKANRLALISAVSVLIFQQFSGINAVVFYTAPIFKAAGSTLSPNVAAIIVGLVQVVVSYISVLIIEKANRRFYLMISSAGMLIFLGALGMYFHLKHLNIKLNHVGFIPISSLVLFMVCFSVGYGPVPWMLLGELFAPEIKGIASGFAILTNWSFAFIVTFFFPIINNAVGVHVTFYIFAVVMAIATIFVYFVVPETRGKSLPEIQAILSK